MGLGLVGLGNISSGTMAGMLCILECFYIGMLECFIFIKLPLKFAKIKIISTTYILNNVL